MPSPLLQTLLEAVPPVDRSREREEDLTASEERMLRLGRRVVPLLQEEETLPRMLEDLTRLEGTVRGGVHRRSLREWRRLLEEGDLSALRGVLTGLDHRSIELREVSPIITVLPSQRLRGR